MIDGERLRQDVSVAFTADKVRIAYALWEVTLPLEWVHSFPVVEQLLNRRIPRSEALLHPQAESLVALLSAQGCFVPVMKPSYTLREVKALFDPLRSQWYASYYAHPAWQQLRSGQAKRNVLLAWLIHNYHISRAAGIVAARMAALGHDSTWADFFRQDAMEEYWHCDAYYSLDTPLLQDVTLEQIKTYLPLPASLAFEEHTLQVAESDPLGHVLIAYFQESSIAFENDSCDFYQTVEQQYGMQGLFNPWKEHIRIDVDHGHAEGLGQLLESDDEVDIVTLERALRDAWLAFYFLRCSLDDILRQENSDRLSLRLPQTMPPAIPMRKLARNELAHLRYSLCSSAFRALSFAREHDDLIACGRWAQKLSHALPDLTSLPPPNPWCIAIANHMHEAANHPDIWLQLAGFLDGKEDASETSKTALFQLNELLSHCAACSDRLPDSLLCT